MTFERKHPHLEKTYSFIDPAVAPPDGRITKIFGVDYVHLRTRDGGDLYVTQDGLPRLELVRPENWYYDQERRKDWERLNGSGTLYRVHNVRSGRGKIDIVIKWSRVGQDVPGREGELWESEFNSPFEEFSLLAELREARHESPGWVPTHKPLGIYVPAERVSPDRIGRKPYLFDLKVKSQDIELDLYRQYVLIYEWVKGVDSSYAHHALGVPRETVERLMDTVQRDLRRKGFKDCDRKPNHIIVRPSGERSLKPDRRTGEPLYAYIDFEMLSRTPERERWVKESKRAEYLIRQRDRFDPSKSKELPPHLKLVNIFGVDYIFGRGESTGGSLWVVGRDPFLFDYFLPERWRRTPRKKLSHQNEIFHTTTKDDIHIVWKVCRVGEKPDFFEQDEKRQRIMQYGYNSPFEEISLALEMTRKGVHSIYPRAIYRTGTEVTPSEYISDDRRYESHRGIVMPDGTPALQKGYSYIIVWGYWNGPDELLATRDGEYYSGINLLHAYLEKVISEAMFHELMQRQQDKLRAAGIEDLNLRAEHFMISLDHRGSLILGLDGKPEVRCSNFEFLKKTN